MSFEALSLHPLILKAISECGYTTPTEVQALSIPEVLKRKDLMVSAQTGTGKTAAFMLPALHALHERSAASGKGPRVLVLTPTRELANQVADATFKYGKHLRKMKFASILGGMPYPPQIRALSKPLDILVATPGRLIDHLDRGRLDTSRIELLILDEADRMLDMGFVEDIELIAEHLPEKHQTLLFSATLGRQVEKIASRLLREPERIVIAPNFKRSSQIAQSLHYVDGRNHKDLLLDHWLSQTTDGQRLIFTATKREADVLADRLSANGHRAAALHGDMNQRERNRTMTGMRSGAVRILVATDVAARGIDVPGISLVVNYDLPRSPEDYVHRIGRTGRAEARGLAVSLVGHDERVVIKRIERFTGSPIRADVVAGLEPKRGSRSESGREGSRERKPRKSKFGSREGNRSRNRFAKRDESQSPRDGRRKRFAKSYRGGHQNRRSNFEAAVV